MENFIVSARKYRPSSFQTVVGQQSITITLKNAIKNAHLAHAYLFCGPRGVGKTSCARIFAKTINCSSIKNTCLAPAFRVASSAAFSRQSENNDKSSINSGLKRLLSALQKTSHSKSFGLCLTCSHNVKNSDNTYLCGLTQEPLSVEEIDLICREHLQKN